MSTRGAPVFYGAGYRIASDQGQPCIDLSVDAFADQASADAANAAVNLGLDYLRPSYGGLCPDAAADPAVAAFLPTPEQVALSFLQDFTLPAPQPEVAPGWALTGKTAYLVSNAQPTAQAGFDTVLGPLTFDAESTHLTVDWGDGRGPLRYDSLGAPHPDGDVTTVYGDVGTVTIDVVQHWTLTWDVGGTGGQIDGMTSTATIPDFEIRQLQAVIG